MQLAESARILLKVRYTMPGETPDQLFERVVRAIDTRSSDDFLALIKSMRFLPNSPTLMNAGTSFGQLSACFVLPVEDSIDRIFLTLSHMALIHKTGGGTGFSFSHLRPHGDSVAEMTGVASGPVPFIHVFDEATNALKQGGRRRGANMAVLVSSHPDIFDFVVSKEKGGLSNFNISVGFDKEFFECLHHQREYPLVNPRNQDVMRTIDPAQLWEMIGKAAWSSGDPGVLFFDSINEKNPVPGLGPMEATNPCGEQPLLPYESCNLGSINLTKYVRKNEIDFDTLKESVHLGVEFLDAVIDVNRFIIPEIKEQTLLTRKIGLGVMGFADALIMLGIPYESKEALVLGDNLMAFIQEEGHAASKDLGERKGSFPAIDKSIYSGTTMRNSTVTTIAPTGSIHLIANTSSGIEPVFSLAYDRKINGNRIQMVHPLLDELLRNERTGTNLKDEIIRTGSVQQLPLSEHIKDLLKTAGEIKPEHHVAIQAIFQKHVDNAVSKTVNLPEEATVEDISRIYMLARDLGCKGITIYRYASKPEQVLSRGCELCRADL
ncbi:MAG: adenosylcobalamin-dependent ribonucleoside-diphosphate reductase [Methanoregulaceae archaeon]|nr:adenosylcobalamin-dependent ribonucleoside-diphosphate reductase [Methanoregulaceae archaeon]